MVVYAAMSLRSKGAAVVRQEGYGAACRRRPTAAGPIASSSVGPLGRGGAITGTAQPRRRYQNVACSDASGEAREMDGSTVPGRCASRRAVSLGGSLLLAGSLSSSWAVAQEAAAAPGDSSAGPFCDYTQTLPCDPYPSYTEKPSGLLYQDLRYGEGDEVREGEQVTVDWDGYTFYLQHVVQARNLPKGGDFAENDEGFLRFVVGEGRILPAFEECVRGMKVGGIRRIIVHPGPLSYPGTLSRKGGSWKVVGPEPATLSGRRALDFVLRNTANVDKSLLFDVEVLGVGREAKARRGPGRWAESVRGKVV